MALINVKQISPDGTLIIDAVELNNPILLDNQATTKQYVDAVAQGLGIKQAARVATTANLIANYDNGIGGVGATLIASNTGALVIDNISVSIGDRVLVKEQTNQVENGIYNVSSVGSDSNPFILTRSDDANNNPIIGELRGGTFIFVTEGLTQDNRGYVISSPAGLITLGIDDISWTQFNGAGQIIAGLGLTKVENTLDVGSGQGIQVNADDVTIRLNNNSGLVKNLGIDTNELGINLNPTNPGLTITANILDTKLKSNGGLTTDANGLFLNLSDNAISGTLSISNGGTGQTTALSAFNTLSPLTIQGDLLYFDGTNNVRLPKNTSTTRYLSNTGVNNNPVWSQIDLANGVANTLSTTNGGTGQSTYTDGQLLIGNTIDNTLTKSTLTAGQNISIVNGSGSITINSTDLSNITTNTAITTDNVATTIKTIPTVINTVTYIETYANARRTSGTSGNNGDSASFKRTTRIKNVDNTVTIENTQSDYTSRDQNWELDFIVNGTDILVQVIGTNDNNIFWSAVTKTLIT